MPARNPHAGCDEQSRTAAVRRRGSTMHGLRDSYDRSARSIWPASWRHDANLRASFSHKGCVETIFRFCQRWKATALAGMYPIGLTQLAAFASTPTWRKQDGNEGPLYLDMRCDGTEEEWTVRRCCNPWPRVVPSLLGNRSSS
ncbi:hypothetical protein K456DRAFT_789812 [Colletotrichum gloeosporioides 23]|nr:hypothetical protein K456DRAFT_789812 [Colletotrichum gloeosporioides 23]